MIKSVPLIPSSKDPTRVLSFLRVFQMDWNVLISKWEAEIIFHFILIRVKNQNRKLDM